MTWDSLKRVSLAATPYDLTNGPANSKSKLRLFGKQERDVRVTFYRDNHAWCPYCQKVWLWLEEKKVPYRVAKVTMFCYGEKEPWYKKKVPSGMLPALELDGRMITESDEILASLEDAFGPVEYGLTHREVVPMRRLERVLFRAWCNWLCSPARSMAEERNREAEFEEVVMKVEQALAATPGDYMLDKFSSADIIFTPYVERMNASLFYYKGYRLRGDKHPRMSAWFDAMETRETYRGTQSDFHTHSHDLPPQMGGCYRPPEASKLQRQCEHMVDNGPFNQVPDCGTPVPADAAARAIANTIQYKDALLEKITAETRVPLKDADEALRCALSTLWGVEQGEGGITQPPKGTAAALRYVRDRINVPRDMPLHSARKMRQALEETAAAVGNEQGPPINTKHRRDQDPTAFRTAAM
jgi:glutathione S-transferase